MKRILMSSGLTALIVTCILAGMASGRQLTVMTHDSFNVSKEVVAGFEKEHGATIRFLKSGDAGAALVQAILSKENPLGDVFYGVDNTFLSRALRADIFMAYPSPLLADIPASLKLDPENRLLPVDYGDVCLNYDKGWFEKHQLAPPSSLSDLVKPEYKGLLVVENPATSSPGLSFLLATVGHFGEDGYLDFWKKLKANGVVVANGWEDAYYGHFTAASEGDRPIVVSYASSPPAAVYFSETPVTEAPTAAVVSDGSAFRQVEFVGILKGAREVELAKRFVDFMLDRSFQEDIPLQMFVFPANSRAAMPKVFTDHAVVAENPAVVSPEAIEANREKWIADWTATVLR